jgi:hypothetical protein
MRLFNTSRLWIMRFFQKRLSPSAIGSGAHGPNETTGETNVSTQAETETMSDIQTKRKYVFERIASLNDRHRSASDTENFFDNEFSAYGFPANRHKAALEYFADPRIAGIDPIRGSGDSYVLEKVDRAQGIAGMLEALYRAEQADLKCSLVRSRVRMDRALGISRDDRLREDTFKTIAKLTGRSITEIRQTFKAIDWQALANDRNNMIRANLYPEIPEPMLYRREATNQAEHDRRLQEERTAESARAHAKEAIRQTILLFQNLRAELNRLRSDSQRKPAA